MIIFFRLILAHLLTDFTLQFDQIALWKRRNVVGVLVHSLIFLVIGLVLTWNYLTDIWVKFLPGWLCLILISISHFLEDYYRVLNIKKSNSTTTDSVFFFFWDQFIHIGLIFLLSPINVTGNKIEPVVIISILAVFVTHFISILIYYLEQSVYGYEQVSYRLKYKYYLILERLFMFIFLLLPGKWWIISIVIWIVYRILQKKLDLNFTKLNIVISIISVIIAGLIGRFILYYL